MTRAVQETKPETQTTPEYAEGFQAARRGELSEMCPHASAWTCGGGFNDARYRWLAGWLDANYSRKREVLQ